MLQKTTILILFSLLGLYTNHTFYASICTVREKEGRLEVKLKVFTDDLQQAIRYEMGKSNFSEEAVVKEYVLSKLKFWINQKPQSLTWKRVEREGDASYCYLSLPKPSKISHVKIQNELLVQSIAQQVNIVRLHLNGEKRFFNLDQQIRFEATEY